MRSVKKDDICHPFLLFKTGFFLENMENKYISSCHICYFPLLPNNDKVIKGKDKMEFL